MSESGYVLDSYALLALLEGESGADRVAEIISDSTSRKYMSVVNVGEILYIVARRRSSSEAEQIMYALQTTDDIVLEEVSLDRAAAAARLKVAGGLSYADCFAAALAQEKNCVLVTGDPEFSVLQNVIAIEWLK